MSRLYALYFAPSMPYSLVQSASMFNQFSKYLRRRCVTESACEFECCTGDHFLVPSYLHVGPHSVDSSV